MRVYSMEVEELTEALNLGKEAILAGLEKDGFLKEGQAKTLGEMYALVIHKKGWFGTLWDRLFGDVKDPTGFRLTLVKIV